MARIIIVAALLAAGSFGCGEDASVNDADVFTDVMFQLAWNDGSTDPLPTITVRLVCTVDKSANGGAIKATFERAARRSSRQRFCRNMSSSKRPASPR